MRDTFKENRVYPYHFMYDTGLMEELRDIVLGKRGDAEARVGGLAEVFRIFRGVRETQGTNSKDRLSIN
jgi:hypothetical protein